MENNCGSVYVAPMHAPWHPCGTHEATKYSDDNCTTYMGLRGSYNDVSASEWTWIGGTFGGD